MQHKVPNTGRKVAAYVPIDQEVNVVPLSAHGDTLEFISQTEGLSFKKALEKLALVTSVELPKKLSATGSRKSDKLTAFSAKLSYKLVCTKEQRHCSLSKAA
ncbi:DNA primase [Dirofilaria immitis]